MQRTASRALCIVLTASTALGGCSWFKSEEKERAETLAAAVAEEQRLEPVERVLDLEIGRTRDGFMISVTGLAPGLGYSAPELRPRREGAPGPDGFIDLDFVVQAPDPRLNLGVGEPSARHIQVGLPVTPRDLRGATGIRIHGLAGGLQMAF